MSTSLPPHGPVPAPGRQLPSWTRPALLAAGGLVGLDGLAHLLQPGLGLVIGLGALAGGVWLLAGRHPVSGPRRPDDLQGWIERCQSLLPQFERFASTAAATGQRCASLEALTAERGVDALSVALVGGVQPGDDLCRGVAGALRGGRPLRLQVGNPLPRGTEGWCWPDGLAAADVLVYQFSPPLRASDLRWLEALPAGQPVWLLVHPLTLAAAQTLREELPHQWPGTDPERLLCWDGTQSSLAEALAPLSRWLHREASSLRAGTGRRRLENLHDRWLAELEVLRRGEAQQMLRRTQWVVAAGVLLAPLPSLDLLVLSCANGLLLREMAELWNCSWSLDQLRAAAAELARAALVLGVIEWSSQALVAAARLHGATWLVAGGLQALSAAYLTRVVGRAMADTLALSAGVAEPDLARLRLEAPLLVARAAEQEKLDWADFLRQARRWWEHQGAAPASA